MTTPPPTRVIQGRFRCAVESCKQVITHYVGTGDRGIDGPIYCNLHDPRKRRRRR